MASSHRRLGGGAKKGLRNNYHQTRTDDLLGKNRTKSRRADREKTSTNVTNKSAVEVSWGKTA